MKHVVIPDPHNKVHMVEKILANETYDDVTFLGDWFDDFGDNPEIACRTAGWINAHRREKNWTWLWGNHDLMYRFPTVHELQCSGYTITKALMIQRVLKPSDWNHWKLFRFVDNWLVSHAGVHPDFAHPRHGLQRHWLERLQKDCLNFLQSGRMHFFVAPGQDRCGPCVSQNIGGIDWLDWSALVPIPGLNQLVGHSAHCRVQYKTGENSVNACIDTQLRHYAVIEDGVLTVKEVNALAETV